MIFLPKKTKIIIPITWRYSLGVSKKTDKPRKPEKKNNWKNQTEKKPN